MTKAIVQSVSTVSDRKAMFTAIILSACILTAFFYAINLYSLISKTVAIREVEKETAALRSKMAVLGAEYLRLSSQITPDKLSEYGLEPGQVTAYINRPYQTASIGTNLARGSHEL